MIRALDKWLLPYLRHTSKKRPGPRHVLICICDHYEPLHAAGDQTALQRVLRWKTEYPNATSPFADSTGRHPRHTFFYPIEKYRPALLSPLTDLCHETGCELEVHLHHRDDNERTVAAALASGIEDFSRHTPLGRRPDGTPAFAFIHGNWALQNCAPHGQNCGVTHELSTLRKAGCYADLTFPSAPHPTQPSSVNSIGYAKDTGKPTDLNVPIIATKGKTTDLRNDTDHLLLIQGPLGLNWKRRKWGIVPRIENSDLTRNNPPTAERLDLWIRSAISVVGQPDWAIVKLHTHGALPANSDMFLGHPMAQFHAHLRELAPLHYHYVTARELTNVIHAAEDGHSGNPADYFDYLIKRA